eukprot:CAMPEP_0113315522 /NCGR_PEP_ID=MMETSP0010_2-20120614/11160_1 /TAXON_ID=216773 ORGANISM="Corethron hystrix, Strain 308" /NCGR_SAMPLE_ID=MMETSP0010_2 /ASSEMBLY_ACC=CAM_ASM_000155 /LENGTH=161 /DNA_ID=CAMNT_0000172047 /DNA_START=152 /DNA_END=637 /DNA_ORIENTATION=+ /assembly_acc=CAM_ASM_000155
MATGNKMFHVLSSQIRSLNEVGTIHISVGCMILGYIGVDSYITRQNTMQRIGEIHEMESSYAQRRKKSDERLAQEHRRKLLRVYGDMQPPKYRKKVAYVPPSEGGKWDGLMALKNVKEEDVLDVLLESVGPNGAYSLCRVWQDAQVVVGWYPVRYLKDIDE